MTATHHLVPVRQGRTTQGEPAFVPVCRYCQRTRSELAALHNDQDVTRYECDEAPR